MACSVLAVLGASSLAHAAPPCEALGDRCPMPLNAESARGLALATGLRASAISSSALAYNPAALAFGKLYHVEGMVDYMPDLETVALGGSVVDSSTSSLAAGLSFRGFLSGDKGIGGVDGRIALAFPFSDSVSIGVSGRYINAESEAGKKAGLPNAQRLVDGFTMDASLRIAPIPELQLHFSSYNFINLESVYAPVMVGGGAAFALGSVVLTGADVIVDLTSYNKADVLVGGGLEILAAMVPIRAGYSYETGRHQHTLGAGIGYSDRSLGFDLSLRQQLGGQGDTRLVAAVRFYVR